MNQITSNNNNNNNNDNSKLTEMSDGAFCLLSVNWKGVSTFFSWYNAINY